MQHGGDERYERSDSRDEAEPIRGQPRRVRLVQREKQHGARGLEQRDEADRSKTYDERIGGEEHGPAALSAR